MSRANDDELIAAYLDGVGELEPTERQRVEHLLAEHPSLRGEAEAMRDTIGKLRALSHEGIEPDWNAMARGIRQAVGPLAPRRWWRRSQWMIPIAGLATTAAIALVWIERPRAPAESPHGVAVHQAVPAPAPATATAIWLDGEAVDIDNIEPNTFDDLDRDARAALSAETDDGAGGILPASDLNWIDDLDDGAIERAEHWLDRKKS